MQVVALLGLKQVQLLITLFLWSPKLRYTCKTIPCYVCEKTICRTPYAVTNLTVLYSRPKRTQADISFKISNNLVFIFLQLLYL